jgi:hypothetical protein
MYIADLSPYTYWSPGAGLPGVIAVGWLSVEHSFPTGSVSESVVDKLSFLAGNRMCAVARGFHVCDLCKCGPLDLEYLGKRTKLGMSEIWIPDAKRDWIHAAPSLIIHYISQHQYLPPAEFIDAVNMFQDLDWDSDAEFKRRTAHLFGTEDDE